MGSCAEGTSLVDANSLVAVRCVSDDDRSADGWKTNDVCDNYWESSPWNIPQADCTNYDSANQNCKDCQTLNWRDASAFCASQGGRLPTLDELLADCVKGSGCSFDFIQVWSSTESK